MLKSRISTKPDMARVSKAVERPGIDPRVWVCTGYVEALGIDEEGPFVDVTCMPTEEVKPCRLASIYTGPGYGFYFPVEKDDEVLVFAPNGDPNAGLVALPGTWSKSDPPPQDMIDEPTNLHLYAKEGVNINVTVSGGGTVKLGSKDAEEAVVLGNTFYDELIKVLDGIKLSFTEVGVGPAASGPNGALKLETFLQPFKAAASSFLSDKVKAEK